MGSNQEVKIVPILVCLHPEMDDSKCLDEEVIMCINVWLELCSGYIHLRGLISSSHYALSIVFWPTLVRDT